MITLERPTIYDEALHGEPLGLRVRPRALNTDRPIWTVGEWVLLLPATAVHHAPDVQRMITEIRAWTGWSKRQLATVLGTSHTTVVNAEGGRPCSRPAAVISGVAWRAPMTWSGGCSCSPVVTRRPRRTSRDIAGGWRLCRRCSSIR